MEGLVLRSLTKIRKLTSSSRKQKPLKDACDTVIEHLKAKGAKDDGGGGGGEDANQDTDADKFFEPFKLACESKSGKIQEVALDAIQKLVAYGYLRGTSSVNFSTSSRGGSNGLSSLRRAQSGDDTGVAGAADEDTTVILMDVIIQTICDCNEQQDDNVQLQVMKALLECVISNNTEVHQASLLQAVRACYNIHLVSRNQVNKTTARATLTQMLSIVFHRMEAFDHRAREEAQAALQAMEQTLVGVGIVSPTRAGGGKREGGVVAAADDEGREGEGDSAVTTPVLTSPVTSALQRHPSSNGVTSTAAGGGGGGEESDRQEAMPCGENMYPAVYVKLGYVPQGNRPISLVQRGRGDGGSLGTPEFPSVLHKDAYLLFRALCRLSVKGQYDGDHNVPADPVALQSKILSLELLLSILEHAGPTFRSSDKFVYLVRNHLCTSLLKNATSSNTLVVGLSLRIFIAMISHFKDSLKAELEVFISNIFLKLLESENSSFEHKMLVLEVFQNLCQDPQLLIEIFLNYDCDLGATSMFSRIVSALSKVANGRQLPQGDVLSAGRRLQEEMTLRTGGLEGLVAITHSLVKAGGLDEETLKKAASAAAEVAAAALAGVGGGIEERDDVLSDSGSGAGGENGFKGGEGGEEAATTAASRGFASIPEQGPSASSSGINISALALLQQTQSSSSLSVVESYDRKQKLQEEMSLGILKFNLKPSQGLAYLEAHGHLVKTPQDVARFLHNHHDRLDKSVIGDYLGKEKEYDNGFCVKVLHEYVDMMDFANLDFDQGIRHFLAGFRLPGEAQKIDRIMEKFAERYCLQNPTIFPSADTAFILSFSTIMLNTDLHNPSVREDRKMTKEDFIRNNRGISSGADLPEPFLSKIYDNIKRSPISLKEDDDMRAKIAANSAVAENPFLSTLSLDKRRKAAYQKEREAMVQASEAIFRQRKRRESAGTGGTFRSPLEESSQYVRPMFEVAWGPMLSVLSQVIKSSDDPKMIGLSLQGFRHSIRIAAHFNLPTARDLLVNTLYKFTTLSEIKEVKPKNIDCIKSLMTVALTDGDHLNEAWFDVLQCISHLARLQLFASGLQSDDVYFPAEERGGNGGRGVGGIGGLGGLLGGGPGGGGGAGVGPHRKKTSTAGGFSEPFRNLFSQPSKAEAARQVEEFNAGQIMASIDVAMIERVFTQSVQLDSQAIQHFVIKLCEVSQLEVAVGSGPSAGAYRPKLEVGAEAAQPRVFSLQKLVEVADFNMTARSRLVWANVWEVLSRHYAAVGLHENVSVAMYAIDSLRQLSMKFLYKDELRDFNFQRLFLKPFEVIMASARTVEIKELILRCIDNLISARAHNIRSGWKSIFTVFSIAASSSDEGIAQFAFDMTDHLFRNHFDLLIFDFVDLVNCLLGFAENRYHLHISLAAIAHLQRCATLLSEGTVAAKSGGGQQSPNPLVVPSPRQDSLSPATSLPTLMSSASISEVDSPMTPGASPAMAAVFTIGGAASGESGLQLWWPLLVGLSARVADSRLPARTSALEALMNTLRQHGQQFSSQTWKLIFRGVLFPLLESARTDCTPQVMSECPSRNPPLEVRDDSWILTTTESVLRSYVELLRVFWSRTKLLAPEVLAVISDCICQHERETLARIAVKVLHHEVILGLVEEIQEADLWNVVSACLLGIVRKNLPEWISLEMLAAAADGGGGMNGPSSTVGGGRPGSNATLPSSSSGTRTTQPSSSRVAGQRKGEGLGGEVTATIPGETDGETTEDLDGRDSFSTPADDLDDEQDEEDSEDEAERLAANGSAPARDVSFSFAMVNNGTIMTQMVVSLLAQQMIKDYLSKYWIYFNEENLTQMINALIESADYAAEFNANLMLRERLRQGGLMQAGGGSMNHRGSPHGGGSSSLSMSTTGGRGAVGGLTRLPHLHEQAIDGYAILMRVLLRLYSPLAEQEAQENGGLGWDRRPVVERVFVRYAALILRQYVQIEQELVRGRRAAPKVSIAASHAMNTEVAAYTPLVLFILRSIRTFPLDQIGWHLDWIYPALADLLTVRSLEVRREVRSLLHDQIAPYALGKALLPLEPRAGSI